MAADLTYEQLVTHIAPGPRSLSYFVPLLLLPLAFSIPPWVVSRQTLCAIFLPIITGSLIHAWTIMGGVDVLSFNMLLHSYFLLLFNDPRRDFRRVFINKKITPTASKDQTPTSSISVEQDDSTPKYTEQAYPSKMSERLPWIGTLLISMRFVDWKIGSPSHDARQPFRATDPPSHLWYIITAIMSTLTGYLVLDLTTAWIQQDPYFLTFGTSIDSPLPVSPLPIPFQPRLLRCTILALQVWATVGQQFKLPCCIPVTLHYFNLLPDSWSPHLWPPFFGPFPSLFSTTNLSSLRNFWGTYWHQTLRYNCSGPATWLANLLHLPRRSQKRYFLLSATTFVLSGLLHLGVVPPSPLSSLVSANIIRLHIATFFVLQPLGFAVEMAVSAALRPWKLQSHFWLALNVLWFVTWCCVVLPLLGEAARNLGYWRLWPVPLSVWRGVTVGQWRTLYRV